MIYCKRHEKFFRIKNNTIQNGQVVISKCPFCKKLLNNYQVFQEHILIRK